MKKQMEFTKEQKSLIWERFVAPQGGSQAEVMQFVEICETFGLNPILGDIVFQKRKNGSVNFITTRDGLLRVATKQDGYVGAPNAGVVKEGDEFEFKPNEGEVHHKFGTKRGNIIGAYAVMNHAKHNPVAVFVDFEEYFNANSGALNSKSGYANTWDKMPSAMIVKVAEVFVLRRQFPLGGLYTREEMSLEDEQQPQKPTQPVQNTQKKPDSEPVQNKGENPQPVQNEQSKEEEKPAEQPIEKLSQDQVYELEAIINDIAETRQVEVGSIVNALGKPLAEIDVNGFESVKAKLNKWLTVAKQSAEKKKANANQGNQEQEKPENMFTAKDIVVSQAPNGTDFAKIHTAEHGSPLFTRDPEVMNKVKSLNQGDTFIADVKEENGFLFLVSIDPKSKTA